MELTATREDMIAKNSTINMVSWVINLLITFFTIPFFIRQLSPDGYGVWVLVSGVTGYFALLQFGIGPAITKYVAKYRVENDFPNIQNTVTSALLFSMAVGCVGGALIWGVSPVLSTLFKLPPALQADATTAFGLAGIFFPFALMNTVYMATFAGYQRYLLSNLVSMTVTILTALCGSLALWAGRGLVGLVAANCAANVAASLLGIFLLHRTAVGYKFTAVGILPSLKTIFGYSAYTFVSQIAQIINSKLAEIILGITVGPAAVTLINVPVRLVGLFSSGASSLSAALFPYASELEARGNLQKVRLVFLNSTRYFSFVIVPFYFMFIFYSKAILEFWLNSSEMAKQGAAVMSLYAVAYLAANMTTIPTLFLQGFGRVKFISQFSMGLLVMSLLCYYPSIHAFGATGAGVAVLITQVFGVLFIFYSLKMLQISLGEYLRGSAPPFLFGLIASVCGWMIYDLVIQPSIANMGLALFGGISLCLFFYVILCWRFSEMKFVAFKYVQSVLGILKP